MTSNLPPTLRPASDNDIAPGRRSTLAQRTPLVGDGAFDLVAEVQDEAERLRHAPVPVTLISRVMDSIAPSPARAERHRGEKALMRQDTDARIAIHAAVTEAQVEAIRAHADVYAAAASLAAAEAVSTRAQDVTARIENQILASGAAFDQAIDDAAARARTLQTGAAQQAAGDRIERLTRSRGALEEAILDRVTGAVQGRRTPR